MKRAILLVTLAFSVLSCTEKLALPAEPVVESTQILLLRIPLVWTAESRTGVYGSSEGDNVAYVPMNRYIGGEGEAQCYGPSVEGTITAYYPYSEDGRPELKGGILEFEPVQDYYSSAAAQLLGSTVMVGSGSVDNRISLDYLAGVLHIRLQADIPGDITGARLESSNCDLCGSFATDPSVSPRLYGGGHTLTLTGLFVEDTGAPRSVDLWFVLPEGEYTDLSVSVSSSAATYSRRAGGVYRIAAGRLTDASAVNTDTTTEPGDLIVVTGEFDNL